MKRPDPVIPDSEATRRALLPSRLEFWKRCLAKTQNDQDMALHVERLQAELDELENGVTTDEDGLRTAGAVNHGGRQ